MNEQWIGGQDWSQWGRHRKENRNRSNSLHTWNIELLQKLGIEALSMHELVKSAKVQKQSEQVIFFDTVDPSVGGNHWTIKNLDTGHSRVTLVACDEHGRPEPSERELTISTKETYFTGVVLMAGEARRTLWNGGLQEILELQDDECLRW